MFIACELRSKLPDQVIAGILSGRAHHFDASFLATRRPYLFSTWICSAPQCAAFGCIVDRRASRDTAQAFRRCRVFLVRITVETMACTAQFRSACMNITILEYFRIISMETSLGGFPGTDCVFVASVGHLRVAL